MNRDSCLVRCGTLIDGTGRTPCHDVWIAVENGRIREVAEHKPRYWQNGPVMDFFDKFVLPGMIDGHVHLVMNPGPDPDRIIRQLINSDDQQLLGLAVRNSQQALVSGITTLRDCGDRNFVTLRLRELIVNNVIAGPRLFVSGPAITITGGHGNFLGLEVDTMDELKKAVRYLCKKGVDHIKVMGTGGLMTPGSNIRRSQFSPDELAVIRSESRRFNRRVASHILTRDAIDEAVTAGIDTIEHCVWFDTCEGEKYDPDVVKRIVDHGTWCGITLTGIYRPLLFGKGEGRPNASREDVLRWLGHFKAIYDSGARVFISSDAGATSTYFDEFPLSLEVAVKFMGLNEMQALTAVTRCAAEAIGFESGGTLQKGKLADMLVLDDDPLKDIANLRNVHCVIKEGSIVAYQGGLILKRLSAPG
jgi:imidazolonepropionase-like amidohydrolase